MKAEQLALRLRERERVYHSFQIHRQDLYIKAYITLTVYGRRDERDRNSFDIYYIYLHNFFMAGAHTKAAGLNIVCFDD